MSKPKYNPSLEVQILQTLLRLSNKKVTRNSIVNFVDLINDLKGNSAIKNVLESEVKPILVSSLRQHNDDIIQLKASDKTKTKWKVLIRMEENITKSPAIGLGNLNHCGCEENSEIVDKYENSTSKPSLPFGFVSAVNFKKDQEPNTFQLPGEVGKFLGRLHRNKMAIVISGEKFGGKTTWTIEDLVKAFLQYGLTVGLLEMEQGGMENPDTFRQVSSIPMNLRSKLSVSGNQMTLDQANELAKHFDVVVVDSFQKFIGNPPASKMDELRQKNPSTIWVFIFQKNAEGGTKGGSASGFDANIVLEQMKVGSNPDDRTLNYVRIEKNRGNSTNLVYNNLQHKTYTLDEYDKILHPPTVKEEKSEPSNT